MSPDEIARALEGLQRDVNKLSNDATKRLAAETADERIVAWEKKRLSVILVILTIFGIATYTALTDKVTNYFVETIKPRIANEIRNKTALVSAQDPEISDLRIQIAELSKNMSDLSKSLTEATQAAPVTVTPIPSTTTPPEGGYSFFGVRDASGEWTERYFDIENEGNRPPKQGDRLRATGSVNIRKGYIVYSEAGWVNKPSIGVLRSGDVVLVSEVREVVNGFWWISFTPEKQEK